METYLQTDNLISFIVGVVIGVMLTLVITSFRKGNYELIKILNIFMFFVWIGLHIYGFFIAITVPYFFDIVAGVSVEHLLGFDVASLIDRFKK